MLSGYSSCTSMVFFAAASGLVVSWFGSGHFFATVKQTPQLLPTSRPDRKVLLSSTSTSSAITFVGRSTSTVALHALLVLL